MTKALEGKIAVVTGASEGIGLACAQAYLNEGAQVVAISRSHEKLSAAFNKYGSAAIQMPADLLNDAECDALIPNILKKVGCIDIFHANAGLYVDGYLHKNDTARIRDVVKLNTTVPMINVHDVLPHMIERKTGDILITSSLAAHFPTLTEPVYASSKRAIREFGDIMSHQIRDTGVRLGMLSPGPVMTAMANDWPAERRAEAIATGSVMDASQIGEAAVFMLTRARNMNMRDMVIRPSTFDIYNLKL